MDCDDSVELVSVLSVTFSVSSVQVKKSQC